MKENDKAIGVFDSGLGGLTVFKALRQSLPYENLIYFGDTARVPYGTKSKQAVISFATEVAGYLLLKKVKMLVIACNTSTSVALNEIKRIANVPVCGVIAPGVKSALSATPKNGKILIIGTNATINSHAYSKFLLKNHKHIHVLEQACPLLVPLVEEGWTEKNITEEAAREYLMPYIEQKIDTLILGCTHYMLVDRIIKKIMGLSVHIVNSALATANTVKQTLEKYKLLSKNKNAGKNKFIVSDAPEHFALMAKRLLAIEPEKVFVKRF